MSSLKKYSLLSLIFVSFMLLSSCSNSGGTEVIDQMCNTLDKASSELDKCKTYQELQNSNYIAILNDSKLNDEIIKNKDYVLTSGDKEKLKKSFINFINIFMNKVIALSEGSVDESVLKAGKQQAEQEIENQIKNSKTLGDLTSKMNI